MQCIYCLKPTDKAQPRAHIFPESVFGDHDELVLTNGEVCGDCNNYFSRMESKFKSRLGLIPLLVGPGVNKRGKHTTVDVPGIHGRRDPADPYLAFNLGKTPFLSRDGRIVQPARKIGERVGFEGANQPDGTYKFSMQHEIRLDSVLFRVVAKIGFETVCLHTGAQHCCEPRWESVRRFIRYFEGTRTFYCPATLSVETRPDGVLPVPVGVTVVPVPVAGETGEWQEWFAQVRAGIVMVVDLSATDELLALLWSKAPPEMKEQGQLHVCRGKPASAR